MARAPAKNGRSAQEFGIRPIEAQIVGEEQLSAAADAPAIGEEAGADRLAMRGAAEDDGFDEKQFGVRREVRLEPARQPSAVEEDRLLRQPVEARAFADGQAGRDLGRAAGRSGRSFRRPASSRRRGSLSPSVTSADMRSPPVRPPAVLISTACVGSPPKTSGSRTFAAPDW